MRTVDRVVGYNRAGRDLRERVDDGHFPDDDVVEAEIALALDAEAADERGVDTAAVAEGEEIVLAELRALVDAHVPPDARAEQAVVEHLQGRVHGEDAAPGDADALVDDPPAEVIAGPHTVRAGLVLADDEPFEEDGRDGADDAGCAEGSTKHTHKSRADLQVRRATVIASRREPIRSQNVPLIYGAISESMKRRTAPTRLASITKQSS